MIAGLSGTLLSHQALEDHLLEIAGTPLDSGGARACRQAVRALHAAARGRLGPASGARAVFDEIAAPLFAALGYRVLPAGRLHDACAAGLAQGDAPVASLIATGWGRDPASSWRDAVRYGIAFDLPWTFVVNGAVLRVFDSRRTYSRRHVQFQLQEVAEDERTFEVFWHLLRATGAGRGGAVDVLDRAAAVSERHRSDVREALQRGVEAALVQLTTAFAQARARPRAARRLPRDTTHTASEALVVIYRVLFLLFAEARGLVPSWHPIYRHGYMVEALSRRADREGADGLWAGLQAVARLASDGCVIAGMRVPPFNGRLFSPRHSPLADRARLDDRTVRAALLALTTRRTKAGRVPVAYGDLGVEQLGGIYERVLDFEPVAAGRAPARRRERKATGSFYTPRSLTDYVVRRTLAPLVRSASAESILALRILDPAMGSGAFLVSACRFLASAYEAALVREGAFATADVREEDRVAFRRAVAQQCLYGVDANDMAVQLGRLSLWLATLAADRPLTFLDHRLRTGNSLVGAALEDIARQPPGARSGRVAPTPLFEGRPSEGALQMAAAVRRGLEATPDDTLAQVREKERVLASLARDGSALARWKNVADLWCAGWFGAPGAHEGRAAFGAAADALLGGHRTLPAHTLRTIIEGARRTAARHGFFHWTLEFPEIFVDEHGGPRPDAGFDAVLTNPPWEMLRADGPAASDAESVKDRAALLRFVRGSGVYPLQGRGHENLYQLFLERALALTRPGGRLGVVLPSGFATDHGSAALRRALLERTKLDPLVSIENRTGLFPIHRSLKILLLSATAGARTEAVACRFGVASPEALDRMPDDGRDPDAIVLPRALIETLSGGLATFPDLRTAIDLQIAADVAFRVPALGDPEGWQVRFGRELNASDDRAYFHEPRAGDRSLLPVVDGRHLMPFQVHAGASRRAIRRSDAVRLLGGTTFERPRLGYRDVASPTNRLSLIAAIVPHGVVTTHTIFCVKQALDDEVQQYLCGMLNSLAANYLVRPRITTHVSAAVVDRLPVPVLSRSSRLFREIAALAGGLARGRGARAPLEARAAAAYGLTRDGFTHVLGTFPLVPAAERDAARRAFCDIVT